MGALREPTQYKLPTCNPQHPKYLQDEFLGFQHPVILGCLHLKTKEQKVFGLMCRVALTLVPKSPKYISSTYFARIGAPGYLKGQMNLTIGAMAINHSLLEPQFGLWTITPFWKGHVVLKVWDICGPGEDGVALQPQ